MSNFSGGFRSLSDVLGDIERVSENEDYVGKLGRIPASKVGEAKAHIFELYRGVVPAHSFLDEKGSAFDSIPYEMQPSIRDLTDKTVPIAPDLRSADKPEEEQSSQKIGSNIRDELKNQVFSPKNTVNVRRITLDIISKYGCLEQFLSKKSDPAASDTPFVGDGRFHRHGVARQTIDSTGVSAKISIHRNAVKSSPGKEIFSLSQLWVMNGSYGTILQTIEPVINTFPAIYGPDPVINMFYTRDTYKVGSKAYNTDNGSFVQTNNKWLLGSPITPVSTVDGDQYYLQVNVKLDSGRWWIYLGGDSSENAIGYYPISVFSAITSTGLAVKSTYFDVGGETCSEPIEPTTFAPMGSGQIASAGWKKSAYARDIKYYNIAGTVSSATVQPLSASPGYSVQRNRYAAPWNETLWYGGPGGT